jgi:hypothetical protein
MKKSDVICLVYGAGFRRIELISKRGTPGEYRCPTCRTVLETFDGRNLVFYRLTVQPSVQTLHDAL